MKRARNKGKTGQKQKTRDNRERKERKMKNRIMYINKGEKKSKK